MSSILRKALMIVPLALLFTAACFAQVGAIEGDVVGADGKPVQGAVIKLERQDVKGNYQVKTNKKGHYYYGGLPTGPYKVTVVVDGQDKDQKMTRNKMGDSVVLDFNLAQAAAAAQAGGPPPVDDSTRGMSAAEKAALEKTQKETAAAMAKNKALNDAFNAGKQAAQASQWDAAVDSFTKAVELAPTQHVVWGNLADSYSSRAAANATTRQADLGKAVEAYTKAIELKADDPAYHNNYALVLAQQKKYDEAQAELTKAAQMDPANAGKYYYNLGAVYVNTGNLDPATAAFKKAIEIDPNYADAYYQFGLSLMGKATVDAGGKMNAPAGTAEAFQKYLELRPDGANAQAAKDMLTSLGSTIQTTFSNRPAGGAPANQGKKK